MAQPMLPYYENKKWGYKEGQKKSIAAEYDTVFPFDKTNRVALVATKNDFNKVVNPLTGEDEIAYDYFYIDHNNNKLKLLAEHFPDSMYTFPDQQELLSKYLEPSEYFEILFQNKLYLFNKNGKQLSTGFDNIIPSKVPGFFETENNSEIERNIFRMKGLIDSAGLTLVKCRYSDIVINNEDSVVYCCSAVFNTKLNDDVFNYKGKLVYTNQKHIEYSSKTLHVLKTYEPKEMFIVENDLNHQSYEIEGETFYYLGKNKAMISNNNNWYFIDLKTKKKLKVDKEDYFWKLYMMLD